MTAPIWLTCARISMLGGVLSLLAWGCGSSTEERLRAAKLAEGCVRNSDCEGDLVCVFERCHEACKADEDCADVEMRCVRGNNETNVCQLPDEVDCERDKDCLGDQVCGVDQECRDPCMSNAECIGDQICAQSDECASTDPRRDRLDSQGRILPNDNGVSEGGTGGATSAAGASGASGGAGAEGGGGGAGSAQGGAPALGEGGRENDAGGAPSVGAAGEGGAGGEPTGPTGEYVESSDGVEPVNNDDREHPLPCPATASLFFTPGDEDWFELKTPDDGRAHVVELALQQETGLRTTVEALAGADFARIGAGTTAAGVSTRMFVTVGPGATTLLAFKHFSGATAMLGKRLSVSVQVRSEQDPHEPNNSREAATPIALGAEISAQMLNPFLSASDQVSADWYAVELTEGTATLSLLAMPTGGRVDIRRMNVQGNSVLIQTPANGVTGAWPFAVPATGTYFISFAPFTGFLPFATGAEPAYMSEPYTFKVEQ